MKNLNQLLHKRTKQLSVHTRITLIACLILFCIVLIAAIRVGKPPVGCALSDFDDTQVLLAAASSDAPAQTDKVVYLTFDDGPSQTTEQVLDILKKEGVPASFFVIAAENNRQYLPLLARTVAEGHAIGLHSCTHSYRQIYQSPEAFWNDIEQLKAALAPYISPMPMCLRFPGGSTNTVSRKYGGRDIMKILKTQAREKGYHSIDWNVSAEDAIGGRPSADTIYKNVVREATGQNRCIVLMHDTKVTGSTAKALPRIIQWFKNAGYRFDTIDHLPQ